MDSCRATLPLMKAAIKSARLVGSLLGALFLAPSLREFSTTAAGVVTVVVVDCANGVVGLSAGSGVGDVHRAGTEIVSPWVSDCHRGLSISSSRQMPWR